MHEHDHIPELIGSQDTRESAPAGAAGAADNIPEMEKLLILLEHWIEHNHEHAETYVQWAEKARAAGNRDIAQMLTEIAAETRKIDGLFERARRQAAG